MSSSEFQPCPQQTNINCHKRFFGSDVSNLYDATNLRLVKQLRTYFLFYKWHYYGKTKNIGQNFKIQTHEILIMLITLKQTMIIGSK